MGGTAVFIRRKMTFLKIAAIVSASPTRQACDKTPKIEQGALPKTHVAGILGTNEIDGKDGTQTDGAIQKSEAY